MILIRNLRLSSGFTEKDLPAAVSSKLKLPADRISEIRLVKKSLDARKKNDIHYNCSAAVSLTRGEAAVLSRFSGNDVSEYSEYRLEIPPVSGHFSRPVVAGFGPAGMFAALILARAGAKPIVIERGADVDTRTAAVEAFRRGGPLDPECNVQFGEGGAGTFSDGKLNTNTHDPRIRQVLLDFYAHGAQESVLYDAKPHIGTDVLVRVVKSIREEIIALGGEVFFNTRLDSPDLSGGRLRGINITRNGRQEHLECDRLILAVGHSARDTFETLNGLGIPMERKPFSLGARIEHPQAMIDEAQYGRPRGELPPADYSLAVHLPSGDSAYTFCMCPGGQVFAAASETGGVCTNGMSYSARDGENANSAVLVTLRPEDFPGDGVLAGMYWQRDIERRAFLNAGSKYFATAQTAGDFLENSSGMHPPAEEPTYRPGVVFGRLDDVLPEKVCRVLREALPEFGKKLKGFDDPGALLTCPETRSSSPVRILRDGTFQSSAVGIYPCGEGAGYAGGITSAAVDGMRCAEAVISAINSEEL